MKDQKEKEQLLRDAVLRVPNVTPPDASKRPRSDEVLGTRTPQTGVIESLPHHQLLTEYFELAKQYGERSAEWIKAENKLRIIQTGLRDFLRDNCGAKSKEECIEADHHQIWTLLKRIEAE